MKQKCKVLAYIFRVTDLTLEILVFTHRGMPDAGIQVVGGTVENGEDLICALKREISEESGLIFDESTSFQKIGESLYQRKDIAELNIRHYFSVYTSDLKDSWSHRVESTGEDNQLLFDFFWLPVDEACLKLTGNMGEFLKPMELL
ncbi:MAG: NUDIX domain-containing protein [Bacteriovoracaceae bacterium]|nr:NUDIX domain-containing protein [Bacteriovoracaceae bacterium]